MYQANPDTGADSLSVEETADRVKDIIFPEDNEDTETKSAEPDTEGEQDEPEAKPEAESEEEGKLSFENLQQLSEALEIPLDDLMASVKARVKVDGEERDVTLKELRDGFQMEQDYRRKTSELSEQRKAFDAERENVARELNSRYQEAQQVTGYLEQQLMGEYNAVNWNELRAVDPAEFAARKQEYNERFNQIQQLKRNVAQNLQSQKEEVEAKQAREEQDLLAKESEKLQAAIPEFADQAKAKEILTQMSGYLKTYGYSDQEIAQVYDHRHVMILRDAMAYRAMQSMKPQLDKKVVTLPKVLKPGAAKSKADINSERMQQLRAKVRKTGNTRDLASLLVNRL